MTRKRILVVDDEAELCELMANSLKVRGYDIETANDGLEAFEKARRFKPDLILLDLAMPKMDGWQTLQMLHNDEKVRNIPTLLLTANAETENLFRSKKLNVLDYFIKPVNLDELLQYIDKYLYLRELPEE